jgi:hypothetical protein
MVLTNLGSIRIGNDLIGSGANATWINGENSLLEAIDPVMTTGILIASAPGNTVRYDATFNNHNIKVPQDGTYYNLEIAGSTIKTLAGGDLLVLGDLTISSTFSSGDNNISVEGDWINSDGFTPGTGEVRFIGTGDQTISNPAGETFHDLLIQKESGVLTLSDNVNVSNTLSLVQGDVNAGSSILYLGTDAANEGSLAYTSGRIIGSFARWIEAASTGTDIVFPVGVSGVTRSATVNFTNLSAGTLTARFVATNPGNNGLPLEETGDSIGNAFSEGYWILEQGNGLASTNYDLSLNGAGFSSFPFDSEVRILKRPSGASPWILDGSPVAPTGNSGQPVHIEWIFRICPGKLKHLQSAGDFPYYRIPLRSAPTMREWLTPWWIIRDRPIAGPLPAVSFPVAREPVPSRWTGSCRHGRTGGSH